MSSKTPIITEMKVIPVAGYDRMLLSLSGAHTPFFTRNIVILKDNLFLAMRASSSPSGISQVRIFPKPVQWKGQFYPA